MERISNYCALASLVLLMILVCFPVRSCCGEDNHTSLRERDAGGCLGGNTQLKRFDDGIDHDSFVSLMGRRSAAATNRQRNASVSRKRNIHGILAELLGRTRLPAPYWRRPTRPC